jgi:hypothetical protein
VLSVVSMRRFLPRSWKRILTIGGIVMVVVAALGAGAMVWLYRGARESNVGELAHDTRPCACDAASHGEHPNRMLRTMNQPAATAAKNLRD